MKRLACLLFAALLLQSCISDRAVRHALPIVIAAQAVDSYTSYRVIKLGVGYEGNPLLYPLTGGTPRQAGLKMFVASAAWDYGWLLIEQHLRRKGDPHWQYIHRLMIGTHVVAAGWNEYHIRSSQ